MWRRRRRRPGECHLSREARAPAAAATTQTRLVYPTWHSSDQFTRGGFITHSHYLFIITTTHTHTHTHTFSRVNLLPFVFFTESSTSVAGCGSCALSPNPGPHGREYVVDVVPIYYNCYLRNNNIRLVILQDISGQFAKTPLISLSLDSRPPPSVATHTRVMCIIYAHSKTILMRCPTTVEPAPPPFAVEDNPIYHHPRKRPVTDIQPPSLSFEHISVT